MIHSVAMSAPKLPLSALRAFEAAARHQNYSRAAEELGLSHGAVSHHLKTLEDMLGLTLFQRDGHRMVATEHGQRLAVHVSEGFAYIARGVEEVKARQRQSRIVSLSVLPPLASRWLIGRLQVFQDAHPEIEVSMRASSLLVDLSRDGIDMGLRYGRGSWPGLTAVRLFEEQLFPVCSPAFAKEHKLVAAKDLLSVRLLHDQRIPWTVWLKSAGIKRAVPNTGATYSDAGHLLEAAAAGHGVALARSVLAKRDLDSGLLVRLFQHAAPAEFAYYIVYPADVPLRRSASLFRDWLIEEAKEG
jgi:LysR family transcriptional regulator, glycine cleavage system transcriptional activator